MLVSCFGCSLTLNAGGKGAGAKPKLAGSKIESAFSVANGKITPKTASLETCRSDNEYLLSALKKKNIDLNNINYNTLVSKKIYINITEKGSDSLTLFHYEIVLQDSTTAMENDFPDLKKQKYFQAHLPLSEAPTTCYVFASIDKLNLLCHYGFIRIQSMPAIIQRLK